jgi:light-regulated signal transduction histidine kinase (bacteriophytochrome)
MVTVVKNRGSVLETCEAEPVHIIGHIQSHGLLFALSEPDFIVRQVSTNVAASLGSSAEAVLGTALETVLGAKQFGAFRARLRDDDLSPASALRV